MLIKICTKKDLTVLTNLLTKKLVWKKNWSETGLKRVREEVVSLEAQTRTNEAEITVLFFFTNFFIANFFFLKFQIIRYGIVSSIIKFYDRHNGNRW